MIDISLKHAYAIRMLKSDAVAHFRSQRAVADVLGISEQAVSMWGDLVPEGRAYQLELLTKGKLRADRNCYSKSKRPSAHAG